MENNIQEKFGDLDDLGWVARSGRRYGVMVYIGFGIRFPTLR